METLRAPRHVSVAHRSGEFVTEADAPLYLDGRTSARCDKPNGDPLLVYIADAFSRAETEAAYAGLAPAARLTSNRGTAAGKVAGKAGGARIKRDGTESATRQAALNVASGVAGFFDRYPRIPYCRQTAYSAENPRRFRRALPLMQRASDIFREHLPQRYAAQADACRRAHPAWVIPGTVFSTVTVNRNFRTALHLDAGDYAAGFGILAAFRRGQPFSGGALCFPGFGVAVDLQEGGLLLADVHEWHGNLPFRGPRGKWERISLVLYFREKMLECLSPEEEVRRAAAR